jgi:capsular polysaccharide biosynthesis protein
MKFYHNNKIIINDNNRTIFYSLFNNVSISENCYYPGLKLLDNSKNIIDPYDEKIMSFDIPDDLNNIKFNNTQNIANGDYFFFVYNFDNYFHFIYDTLPIIWTYFYLKKSISKLKLLINYPNTKNKFYQFNLEFLNLLDLDFVICNNNFKYENVYISSSLTHSNKSNEPPCLQIFEIYNRLTNKIIKNPRLTLDNIYISRRTWIHNNFDNIGTNYTQRRKLINEDELVKELNKLGYIEVFCENLDTSQKINLFKNAKNVIGIVGGGMCNLLFSPPSVNTYCIVSPYFLDINNRFKYSMEHTNIKYYNETNIYKTTDIPMFVRIKTNNNFIGEIIDFDKDKGYLVNLSNNDVAGFNSSMNFKKEYLQPNEFKVLDNGLNSPFEINIKNFVNLVSKI